MAILESRLIRVVEISDLAITLRGVCPAFLHDLWKQRQTRKANRVEEEEELPTPRNSRQSGEFFDPHAPRGGHPQTRRPAENHPSVGRGTNPPALPEKQHALTP